MEFRQWNDPQNDWVLYAGRNRAYFNDPFEMRVTFPGRKYFEGLEAQSTKPLQPADGREIRLQGTSEGRSPAKAKLDSSPQVIAEPPPPPKAFVSHSGQDCQFVQKFVADLCDFGVRAWYSRWEIKAGDSIPQRIEEGIEDCEFFIIVLSKNSIRAPWVQTELQAAIARKVNGKIRKIIPVKIDDCGVLPPIIDTLYRVNFTNRPYEAAVKDVIDSILDVDLRPPLGKRFDKQKDEHRT